MGKINRLDKHVAELIAAGEVVERPSSVIKELVENSIDAGAAAVTVEIKNGGTTYMRVTDNGCGILREDVPVAFLRHATSKVMNQDDLDSIATLGFRGEALASIAAVSRVELLTRTEEELAGTRYVIEGGDEQFCEDAGCPAGTTIMIRDIFYNTPARMKFLKKDQTEANSIAAVLDKIALSRPEVSLRFLRDGKEELHTPGDGKLKSAIYAVFGKEFTAGLIPVDYEFSGVKVWGYVSKPSAARPNRSMQNFFINGRYIKSRTAMVALEEGFKGSIMVGKFPACVLHLQLSFEAVDVNVHPSKLEVRFINERPIFDAVYHGVKTALNREDTPKLIKLPEKEPAPPPGPEPVQMKLSPSVKAVSPDIEEKARPVISYPLPETPKAYSPHVNINIERDESDEMPVLRDSGISKQTEEPPVSWSIREYAPAGENAAAAPAEESAKKVLGEAFQTYVLVERGDELIFIDKHAAHERILYEKLKAESGGAYTQILLEPVAVTLDKNEYAAVLNAVDLLEKAGFELEDFGAGSVLVRSAPLSLGNEDAAEAVMEIAGYLLSAKTDVTTEHLDWLYHNIACRAAIKAGYNSPPEELIDLVEKLERNPDIRYCPHGRPVSIIMKKKELEKQFGRI